MALRRRNRFKKSKVVASSAIDKKQENQIKTIFKKLTAITPEKKWAEYSDTAAVATYSGTIVSFNTGLSQGTADFGNRIGDTLMMTGIRLRIQLNTINYNVPVLYRIILFQYKNDPDGAFATASIINTLLHSTQVGTQLAPSAPYDHDNRSSFKVHYDKTIVMNPTGITSTNTNIGAVKQHKIDLSFKPADGKVQYYAGGTTTTKNELFMLVITDNNYSLPIPYCAHVYYTDS